MHSKMFIQQLHLSSDLKIGTYVSFNMFCDEGISKIKVRFLIDVTDFMKYMLLLF